jgi:DNA-binding MarR family transcriptional regulator
MRARRLLAGDRATLTPARFDVLFVLFERGGMMQRGLRRVLNVVGSTMSEMLGDLEKRGLVKRGRRSRAGRSVELTARGQDAIDRAFHAYMSIDDVIGEAFGGAWYASSCPRLLIWERVCRRVRHACGDTQFKRAFGWIEEYD